MMKNIKKRIISIAACMAIIGAGIGFAGIRAIAADSALELTTGAHTSEEVQGTVSGTTGSPVTVIFGDADNTTKTSGIFHMNIALNKTYYANAFVDHPDWDWNDWEAADKSDYIFSVGDDVFCLDVGAHVSSGDVYTAYPATNTKYQSNYTAGGYTYRALNSEIYHILEAYYSNKNASSGRISFSFDEAQLLIWGSQLGVVSDADRTNILNQYGTSPENINKILTLLNNLPVTADGNNYIVWNNDSAEGKQRLLSYSSVDTSQLNKNNGVGNSDNKLTFYSNFPDENVRVGGHSISSFWNSTAEGGFSAEEPNSFCDASGNFTAPEANVIVGGWRPVSWNTEKDGTGTSVAFGASANKHTLATGGKGLFNDVSVPLYIVWEPINYEVQYVKGVPGSDNCYAKYSNASHYTVLGLENSASATTTGTVASKTVNFKSSGNFLDNEGKYSNNLYSFAAWSIPVRGSGANWAVSDIPEYTLEYARNKGISDIETLRLMLGGTADNTEMEIGEYTAAQIKGMTQGTDYDFVVSRGTGGVIIDDGSRTYKVYKFRTPKVTASWSDKSIVFVYDGNGGVRTGTGTSSAMYDYSDNDHPKAFVSRSHIAPDYSGTDHTYIIDNLYEKESGVWEIATLTGYNTEPDGSGISFATTDMIKQLPNKYGDVSNVPETINLYAQWEPVTDNWGVKYDSNGGTGSIDTYTCPTSWDITLADPNGHITPPANKSFRGWNTAADGSGSMYAAGHNLTIAEAGVSGGEIKTLYAIWTDSVPLVYDLNGKDNVIDMAGTGEAYTPKMVARGATVYVGKGWNGSGYDSAVLKDAYDSDNKGFYYAGWTTDPVMSGEGQAYAINSNRVTASMVESSKYKFTSVGLGFNGTLFYQNESGTFHAIAGNETIMVNDPTTLYLQIMNQIVYSSNYTYNSYGSSYIDFKRYNYLIDDENGTVATMDNPWTRAGYTFKGWNTAPDGSGVSYDPGDLINNDEARINWSTLKPFVLYAQWGKGVTYDSNTSYSSPYSSCSIFGEPPVDSNAYASGETVTVLGSDAGYYAKDIYTDEIYKLDGWTTDKNNASPTYSGTIYKAGDTFEIGDSPVTLYARWVQDNYKVTYNDNFPTGATNKTGSVPVDTGAYSASGTDSATVLGNTGNLACREYTFRGWNTKADGTGLPTGSVYSAGDSFAVTGSTTLYAQWEAKTAIHITYDPNGATSGTAPVDTAAYYPGETITLADNTDLIKTDKDFSGWNTQADGLGTHYAVGAGYEIPMTATGDVTVYADWAGYLKVTYTDPLGGTGLPTDDTHYHTGDTVTVKPVTGVTLGDYEVIGWADDSGTEYNPGDPVSISGDITLHPVYQARINFNGNGGLSGSDATKEVLVAVTSASQTYSITTEGFTKTDNHFVKWTENQDGTGAEYTTGSTPALADLTGNTYYAQWEEDYYTFKFNGNGGTGSDPADLVVKKSDTTKLLPDNPYTNGTQFFAGWNTAADGSGDGYSDHQNVAGLDKASGTEITLYAQWVSGFTVTYAAPEGTTGLPAEASYAPGTPVTVADITGITCGTFAPAAVWVDQDGADRAPSSSFNITKNMTLTLSFTSTVTFDGNGGMSGSDATKVVHPVVTGLSQTYAITDEGFTYPAKHFDGWKEGANEYAQGSTPALNTINGKTLVAQWRDRAEVSRVLDHITASYTGNTLIVGDSIDKNDIPTKPWYKVTWDDGGTTDEEGSFLDPADFTINPDTAETEGSNTVTVSYTEGGVTKTTTVTVPAVGVTETGRELIGITASYPREEEPVDTVLNKGDFYDVIPTYHVTYNNGTERDVTGSPLTPDRYEINPGTIANKGDNVITVSYTENTVPGNVPVTKTATVHIKGVKTTPGTGGGVAVVANVQDHTPHFTVKFDANGGTGAAMEDKLLTLTETWSLPNCTYTKADKAFLGWNTRADGTGKAYPKTGGSIKAADGPWGADEVVTLYAQWEASYFTVRFYGNGGSGTMNDMRVYLSETNRELTSNNFVLSGYTFRNWNTQINGTGTSYANRANIAATPHTDGEIVNLYAQWDERQYFTVRFNGNGGSGTMNDMTVYMTETTRELTANKYTKGEYVFKGWNTQPDGSGKAYADKANIAHATSENHGIVTLYAQWGEKQYFTVRFNANGGYGLMNDMTVYMTETSRLLTANAFDRGEYIFTGWNTKADGTGRGYEDQANIAHATSENHGVITLYAQWEKLPEYFIVRFNGNSGTGYMDDMQVYMMEVHRTLTKNAFKKSGYTFKGWNTKADGTGTSYEDQANIAKATTTDKAVITLYAQWRKVAEDEYFIVTFRANGGSGDDPDDMKVYMTETRRELPDNPYDYSGKKFTGWNTKEDGSGKSYSENGNIAKATSTNKKTIKLYAQWKSSSSSTYMPIPKTGSSSRSSSSSMGPVIPKTTSTTSSSSSTKKQKTKTTTSSSSEKEPERPTPKLHVPTVSGNSSSSSVRKTTAKKPTIPVPLRELVIRLHDGEAVERDDGDDGKVRKHIPTVVKGIVATLVTGGVAVALVMTGTLNYLWLLLLTLLFAKKRKKWHGILTAEENAFLKFEGADEDIPLAQEIIDRFESPGQALAELTDTGSFTILPLGTKVDITYTDQDGSLVTETFDDDEATVYDILDQTTGRAIAHIYNGKARLEFDLVFRKEQGPYDD